MAFSCSKRTLRIFDYLIIVKGREKYIFRYRSGQEQSLFNVLLEYARDSRYGLGRDEIASLIRKVKDRIRIEDHHHSG